MRKLTIAFIAIAGATVPLVAARTITASDALHIIGVNPASRVSVMLPPESWAPQDPADSVWRKGRNAINNREWQKAAEAFHSIRTESAYKSSTYRGQSYYWEAYARAQMGGSAQLRQARTLLMTLQSDFADDAKNLRDASSLLATVNGKLSKDYGDEAAAADLQTSVNKLSEDLGRMSSVTRGTLGTRGSMGSSSNKNDNCPDDDDNNPRVAALNALMQMDAETAMPILEKVMARREPCSATLRARALWLIVQKRSNSSADILLDAIRNDPDDEVKQQAVYWLGQVDGSKALVALQDILRTSKSTDLQQSALFALSQNKDAKANQILRDYAMRTDISSDVRSAAIHFLGQAKDDANYAFLKDMFNKVSDSDGKEQIIYSIAQRNTAESAEWLMNIVMDERQDVDIRNQALYWAANSDRKNASGNALTDSKLIALYAKLTSSEMKQQLIYAFAQRKDAAFVDKLMDIAKNDKDAELRTTAIYWLGQVASRDPRVMKFLADLING
jgi:hypothetical protein